MRAPYITGDSNMTVPHNGLFRDAMKAWMELAIEQAKRALDDGEEPIGAVLLNSAGEMMATGHNTMRATGNPTTHAEMNAFGAAADRGRCVGHDACRVSRLSLRA